MSLDYAFDQLFNYPRPFFVTHNGSALPELWRNCFAGV